MTIETGWYPLPHKSCIRCGRECDPLYSLCDACHATDERKRILSELTLPDYVYAVLYVAILVVAYLFL